MVKDFFFARPLHLLLFIRFFLEIDLKSRPMLCLIRLFFPPDGSLLSLCFFRQARLIVFKQRDSSWSSSSSYLPSLSFFPFS